MYESTSAIQNDGREMPISTYVIAARSSSDRGLSAERTPIGIATTSTSSIAPKTSEAVIGAARKISSLTSERSTNECPSEPSRTRRLRKR